MGLCHLHAGQTVLIEAARAGWGIAIRLARLLGARVLATVGAAWKGERCLDLGADVAIDYRDDVPAAVADATGGRGWT